MIRNISIVADTVKSMGKGNLNIYCDINTKDEIKNIADSVNISISNMKNIITKIDSMAQIMTETSNTIYTTSEQIGQSSNEISAAVSEVSKGAVLQAEEVGNSEDIINKLVEKINAMENQSNNTILNTEIPRSSNELGMKSLEDLKEKFEKNTQYTLSAATDINKLFDSSKSIEGIVCSLQKQNFMSKELTELLSEFKI